MQNWKILSLLPQPANGGGFDLFPGGKDPFPCPPSKNNKKMYIYVIFSLALTGIKWYTECSQSQAVTFNPIANHCVILKRLCEMEGKRYDGEEKAIDE